MSDEDVQSVPLHEMKRLEQENAALRLRLASMEAALRALFGDGLPGGWPDDDAGVPKGWETWTLMLFGKEAGDTLDRGDAYKHFCALSGSDSTLRELLAEAAQRGLDSAFEDASSYACEPASGRRAWAESIVSRILGTHKGGGE